MEKLNGETLNIVNENIEKLKQLFPEAFKEGKIDFETLKAELGESVENAEERYSFNWNGKAAARRIAQTPSTGTLRPCPAESVDWDTTQNLFLEGDNLEVLKLLQKSYHSKVKMIYIDPPYNTGKEFIYPDNFHDNLNTYLQYTGQKDADGRKFGTNADTSGRYHTNWLNMMYPRLKLARNLLRDDGVIFISIDDNEVNNLRKMCDEIFGEGNFVACLPTIMNLKGNQDAFGFSDTHEYTICFSKNIEKAEIGVFPISEEELENWKEDEWGLYKKADTLKRTGQDASRTSRPKGWFPVFITPTDSVYITDDDQALSAEDTILYPVNDEGEELSWSWGKDKIRNEPHNLIVINGRNGKNIYKKQRPNIGELPTKKPKSLLYKPEYSTSTATNVLKNLLEKKLFDGPKPMPYIYDLAVIGLNNHDTVLDFFAGSGTTAHAVMKLNAEDGGNRRCISVQLPEPTDEKSEAYKTGYKTIAEISKERIRRAAKKIAEENPEYKGDLGFKVFKLDSSNIKSWDANFTNVEQSLLDAVDNIKSDRTSEDLLYEILLKYGLDLTLPIETRDVGGKRVYILGYGALIICLDDDVTQDTVSAIAALKEEFNSDITRVVFKDGGFANDVVKTNAIQMLKQHGIDDVKSV